MTWPPTPRRAPRSSPHQSRGTCPPSSPLIGLSLSLTHEAMTLLCLGSMDLSSLRARLVHATGKAMFSLPLICPEHCQVDTTVPFRNPHSSHFLQKWWFRLERPGGRGPPVRLFCASLLPTSGWDAGPRHSHIRGYRDRWCGALPPRPAYRCSGMAGVDTVSKRAWRISPLLREGKVSRLGLASKLGPRLPGRSWYGLVLCCS